MPFVLPSCCWYLLAGVFGSLVGSFLNVVICRLPDPEQSIVRPRSRCPACGAPIRWYDNVPILSFFWLRARCRSCRATISWRYPLVEALAAGLALLLMWRFGPSKEWLVHFAFSAALIAVTFIDVDLRIIPNEISLGGMVVGFACSFLWPGFWKDSLIGLLVGGAGLLLLSEIYFRLRRREGMGMGDVKLLGMLGAWLGWQCLLFVLLFASLQGVVVALVMWLAGVKLAPPLPEEDQQEPAGQEEASPPAGDGADADGGEDGPEPVSLLGAALPFGPFLALAAVEYLFLGQWFYAWIRG